jgi:pimeloyl-ACP methyl ester carboxylesterase
VPSVRANGIDVGYEVHGAGPPLVMLHGATSSGREDFAAQVPAFSKAFQVFLPDARGHATTRWDPADGWSYADLVDDLAAFVDELGIGTFHLVGFSMGAMTGLQFAVRWPERLRTLVVAGITTQREPRTSVLRRLLDPDWIDRNDPRRAEALARRHDPVQGPGTWRRLLPLIANDVAVQPLLGPRELRRIELPALVAVGDRDVFVPVDHAWGLSRQLPDARLFVAPDCSHEITARRPALFNEVCGEFYRSTEAIARTRSRGGWGSADRPETQGGSM